MHSSQISSLQDLAAIQKLTAIYGRCINKGWNGEGVDFDKLPALFSPNARWECAAMSVDVTGIQAILEMLKTSTAGIDFAMHSFTNPIIDIDGDTATGNWLLWVAIKAGDNANEVFQSEDLEYIRTPQGWLIKSIQLNFGAMLKA